MTSDSLFFWIVGFASGLATSRIFFHLLGRRNGGTLGTQPLILNEGRTIRRALEALPDD